MALTAGLLVACVPPQVAGMPPYVMATSLPGERSALPTVTGVADSPDAVGTATIESEPEATVADDWDATIRRALLAGRLLVFSDTARTLTSLANMASAYPGLDTSGRVMSGAELCAALTSPSETESAAPDLLLASGTACIHKLVREGYLEAYVPVSLRPSLRQEMLTPVLTHHWEVVGLHHNGHLDPDEPLTSWWDLVTPAWRGRVALADPLVEDRALGLLEALVAHDDLLRASYRGELGPNALVDKPAWSVWVDALLENEVVLLPSDAEVARWVGDPAQEGPRAGFCSSVHWRRVLRGELNLEFAVGVVPVAGVRWRTYVAPITGARNPDGARLALAWLLGNASGDAGYEPWYQAGLYPARSDVPLPTGSVPRSALVGRLWEVPADLDEAQRSALMETFLEDRSG